MNSGRCYVVVALCLFTVVDGASVWGGSFSDRLVGKGSSPVSPAVPQAPVGKETPEKTPDIKAPDVLKVPPTQQARSVVPGARNVTSSFDIVGLTLGMTQEEAMSLLRARKLEANGKPLFFEVTKERPHQRLEEGDEPRKFFTTVSNARSMLAAFNVPLDGSNSGTTIPNETAEDILTKGGAEVFLFQFPNVPNESAISVISRLQRLAPPVHPDTLRGALLQKYGPPTLDAKMYLVWLTDESGTPQLPAPKGHPLCHVSTASTSNSLGEFDYTLLARKGCGAQLSVHLVGTADVTHLVRTTLFHHQHLLDEQAATNQRLLKRFRLTPEQTKQVPAPQF